MNTSGKIARLPRDVREQLNQRLEAGEPPSQILDWIIGLPEVQAVLADQFGGRSLNKQNLSEWKKRGFREWQMRRAALEFAQNLDEEDDALKKAFAGPLTDKLAHWIALRYAAAAHALTTTDDNPEIELRRLRQFCGDIVALRRGDLSAGRLSLEQARLAAELAETEQEREKDFWARVERPEIQAKLYPDRDPDKIRAEVVRMLDRELLGVRDPARPAKEPELDPAVLI